MQFVPETPEEEKLALIATEGEQYVIGFLQLLYGSALGGPAELDRLVTSMATLSMQCLDRAKARAEVGEE